MKRILLLLLCLSISVSAQVISHGITLTCTQSGTGTATFNVYRATTSGGETHPPLASGLSTCSYNDTTAVIGTKYFYTMTEVVGGIESAPSNEVSAQIVPPNAPTNPAASVH